jgi:RNA polymerase sigma-70 factor (ECF subfamily)
MDTFLPGDGVLLAGFRRGDRDALTRVYRAYSPRVLRYLSSGFHVRIDLTARIARVGPLDLEAAHQETFLRVFSESARLAYDGLRPFEGFLLAIARSAAVDILRSAGKLSRSSIPLEDVPELGALASELASPEDAALEAELRALVGRFLSGLLPTERHFAELRFVERLSQERAGAELGLTRQEVRTREVRLKRALLEYLEAEGWLDPVPDVHGSAERVVATLLFVVLILGGSACM